MQYDKAYTFLIDKMEKGLPAYLSYHNVLHTKAVIEAVEHLGKLEDVTGDDFTLLKTAALFHDSGFLQDNVEHEALSCNLAMKHLPEFGYNAAQIEHVCQMIRATKLPQTPIDKLGQLLCDADLYYLGSHQYKTISDKLLNEWLKLGMVKNQEEWESKQMNFLANHTYFSETAKAERAAQKQVILEDLRLKSVAVIVPHEKQNMAETVQDVILMICGVLMAGFALKFFLVPNRFFDGGVTGISLLIHELYHIPLSLAIVVLNIPLIIFSAYSVSRTFALKTLISVILLGIVLTVLPDFAVTDDKLLISIFGGVFLGIGIGLTMRAGAALDGIEVFALYTLKRTSFTITEIILGINVVIFAIAALKFTIETALYSVLTYFAATRTIDYVVEGLQAYTGVTIISGKSEMIKFQIVNKLGRGITIYKGERGFLPGKFDISADCDIIFTVITRLELRRLKNLVYEVDPNAFVFANTIKEASGGIIKRRHKH